MNYQRTIYPSYAFEAAGYALLTSAVGAIGYGLAEKDMKTFGLGLETIIPALSTIAMSRIVRASVRDISDTLSTVGYK